MRNIGLAAVLLLLASAAHAQQDTITKVVYAKGYQVVGQRHNDVVVAGCLDQSGKFARMFILVKNLSNDAFDVTPEKFIFEETDPTVRPLRQRSDKDVVRSIQNRAGWATLFNELGRAFSRSQTTIRHSDGSTTVIDTPDYSRQAQYDWNQAHINAQTEAMTTQARQGILRRTTLMPNEAVDSSLFFDKDKHFKSGVLKVTLNGTGFEIPIGQAADSISRTSTTLLTSTTTDQHSTEQNVNSRPASQALIAKNILASGTGAYLGVASSQRPNVRRDGVELSTVDRGGPADHAGLEPGDVILSLDGNYLYTVQELMAAVQSHAPGSQVNVRYRRREIIYDTFITLGAVQSSLKPRQR